MAVEFHDFSVKCKDVISDKALQFLEEASSELESQTKRNQTVGRVDGGDTKNSWTHQVDESKYEAVVGNPLENAIWEEFGTGEYALEGKGRKGGWYIPIGDGEGQISQAVVDAYGMKTVYGKNGMKFAHTYGKKPKRPLHKAFTKNKAKIKRRAEQIFKGL